MLNFSINCKTYFIFLLFLGFKSFSQSIESIDKLVDKLSWNSVEFNIHDRFKSLDNLEYVDNSVKKLIKIRKSKANVLLKSIKNPEKTVAIHYILTKIYEPYLVDEGVSIIYIYKECDKLIGRNYFFNGIIWDWYEDTEYTISTKEIEKVNNYWTNRLSGKISSWENDFSKISETVQKENAIKYPCDKIYDNNSDKIDFNQLVELLNSKYPSDKFDKIFKILGNDDKISKFNDCFYISFYPDGISFLFDNNDTLKAILFDSNFKSKLIKNLKFSDLKLEIIAKLGYPDKQSENRFWYEKHNFEISFNDENFIKNIIVKK